MDSSKRIKELEDKLQAERDKYCDLESSLTASNLARLEVELGRFDELRPWRMKEGFRFRCGKHDVDLAWKYGTPHIEVQVCPQCYIELVEKNKLSHGGVVPRPSTDLVATVLLDGKNE